MKPISLKIVRKRSYCWKYFKRYRFIYRPNKNIRRRMRAEWTGDDNVSFPVSHEPIILNEDWINSFIKKI